MAKKKTFTCGTNMGNPKWAKWAHLARLGSQLECKVCFILPTRGSSWTFFVFKHGSIISRLTFAELD